MTRTPELEAVAERFGQVLTEVWIDPPVERSALELARLRAAELIGCEPERHVRLRMPGWQGVDEALVGALSRYPSDARFDPVSRSVISLMEQIVIDANGVQDELMDGLRERLGDAGLTRLVMSLVALAESQRVFRLLGHGSISFGEGIEFVRREVASFESEERA